MIFELFSRIFDWLPPTGRLILVIFLCVMIILTALALLVVVIWLYIRLLQRKQQMVYTLALENVSNVPTTFHLQVDLGELHKMVKSFWKTGKKNLSMKSLEKVTMLEEEKAPQVQTEQKKKSTRPKLDPKTKKKTAEVQEAAKEKYSFVRNIANLIASMLDALVAILPKSVEGPFRSISNSIRKTQQSTSSALSKPKQIASSGRQLTSSAGRLERETGLKKKKTGKKGEEIEDSSFEEMPDVIRRQTVTTIYQVAETQVLDPADRSVINLAIRPRSPFRKLKGAFKIISQQVEMEQFPAYDRLEAVMISGELNIRKLGVGYVLLFVAFCVSVLLFNTWWSLAAIEWITQFLAQV